MAWRCEGEHNTLQFRPLPFELAHLFALRSAALPCCGTAQPQHRRSINVIDAPTPPGCRGASSYLSKRYLAPRRALSAMQETHATPRRQP